MKLFGFVFACLIMLHGACFAQVEITVTQGEKSSYLLHDRFEVRVVAHTNLETCLDGMNHTKVFVSGLEIENQTPWTPIKKGLWQKILHLVVIAEDATDAKVTVLRRVDKEQLFQQKYFQVQGRSK